MPLVSDSNSTTNCRSNSRDSLCAGMWRLQIFSIALRKYCLVGSSLCKAMEGAPTQGVRCKLKHIYKQRSYKRNVQTLFHIIFTGVNGCQQPVHITHLFCGQESMVVNRLFTEPIFSVDRSQWLITGCSQKPCFPLVNRLLTRKYNMWYLRAAHRRTTT